MSTDAPRPTDDPVAFMTREFTRQGNLIAGMLRRAADDVERHASTVRTNMRDLKLDHSEAAIDIVRDLQRLMGNMPFDALIRAAAEADRFVRNPEEGDPS